MSTRWYPLYQKGNPQLRVFLPNFWLKLVKPELKQPENTVEFHCSMEMTQLDVKNYLEKIYNVPVVDVRTRIALGKTKKDPVKGYIVKKDDVKIAYVTLPKDQKFTFPDLFSKKDENIEREMKSLQEAENNYKEYLNRNKRWPGTPGWFNS